MNEQFSRTINLIGIDNYNNLKKKKIIVFGIGGVGAAAALSLVRFGIENITIVDYDRVDISNLNRQVFTNQKNLGQYKCIALRNEMVSINPLVNVDYRIKKLLYNLEDFNLGEYEYIIDAIDLITAKVNLIEYAYKKNINIISSMGAGNRLDPSKFHVTDIFKTYNDPLAKVLRRELKKRSIKRLEVVASSELPVAKSKREVGKNKSTPSSSPFTPPVAGLILSAHVIQRLMKGVD